MFDKNSSNSEVLWLGDLSITSINPIQLFTETSQIMHSLRFLKFNAQTFSDSL